MSSKQITTSTSLSGFERQLIKVNKLLSELSKTEKSSRGNMQDMCKLLLHLYDIVANDAIKKLILRIKLQYKTKPYCTFKQISALATILLIHNDPMLEKLHCVLVMDVLYYFAERVKYAVQLLLGKQKQKVPIFVGSMKNRLKALHAKNDELALQQPKVSAKPEPELVACKLIKSVMQSNDEVFCWKDLMESRCEGIMPLPQRSIESMAELIPNRVIGCVQRRVILLDLFQPGIRDPFYAGCMGAFFARQRDPNVQFLGVRLAQQVNAPGAQQVNAPVAQQVNAPVAQADPESNSPDQSAMDLEVEDLYN